MRTLFRHVLVVAPLLASSCAGSRGPSAGAGEGPKRDDVHRGESKKPLSALERMASPPPAIRPEPWELAQLQRIWAEAQAAGKQPARVTIDAQTTAGYGCDCAHFTHYQGGGAEYGVDTYFYPVVAPDVLPIVDWWVRGTFRLTGHFTGRQVTWEAWYEEINGFHHEPTETRDNGPHPVFLVEGWCYDATSFDDNENLEKMREAGVPLCTQPMTVAAAPVPPWPTLPPDAACTRETVRIRYHSELKKLETWDNWPPGATKAESRTATSRITVDVADGVSAQAVAQAYGAVIEQPERPDVVPEFKFADAKRAVDAIRPLLCDPRVTSASMVTEYTRETTARTRAAR
ncbi:MAG: hypothetical protein HOW73_48460 [Polyangiaceae bacterium]|nr:hypothetical protein [Polyangiaceae bacterium]